MRFAQGKRTLSRHRRLVSIPSTVIFCAFGVLALATIASAKGHNPPGKSTEATIKISTLSKEVADRLAAAQLSPRERVQIYEAEMGRYNVYKSVQGRLNVDIEKPVEPRFPIGPEGLPITGDSRGTIDVVIYSDFQCPLCARMAPVIQQVADKFKGKVRFLHRDFPLEFHKEALPSAVLARCANQQGKLPEAYTMLFEKNASLGPNAYKDIEKKLGLDADKMEKCKNSSATLDAIRKDVVQGFEFGVNGTPALFVNGRMLAGWMSVEALTKVVNEELERNS